MSRSASKTAYYCSSAARKGKTADLPDPEAIQLISTEGELAWAARVFLVVDDSGHLQEDYQLTVKPLAA